MEIQAKSNKGNLSQPLPSTATRSIPPWAGRGALLSDSPPEHAQRALWCNDPVEPLRNPYFIFVQDQGSDLAIVESENVFPVH